MSLAPFLAAPPLIQAHATVALLALMLGPVALYRRRRDRLHRTVGYAWVAAMAATAATGAAIPAAVLPLAVLPLVGPVGPIHALTLAVFWGLAHGIGRIRRGDRAGHAAAMRALYWNGIGIAGLFTLLPGRTLNAVLFPAAPLAGTAALVLGLAALALVALRQRRRQSRPV